MSQSAVPSEEAPGQRPSGSNAVGAGYDGQDFYCDVAIPRSSELEVVHEDEWVLAFHHTKPYWVHHIVIVPKQHIPSLTTVSTEDRPVVERLFAVVQDVARRVEVEQSAAAVLTNLGSYQDSKHLHIHVHSGGRRSPGGPGPAD